MLKTGISLLTAAALLAGCSQLAVGPAASGQPRPAFKDTVAGMATVSALLVTLEIKRQQTQETLKAQSNPQGISKYQSRLTALDAIKSNMASYANGSLSVGDRIALVNASADIAKTRLPDYKDIINTLSTLGQVLMTTQAQMKAGQ